MNSRTEWSSINLSPTDLLFYTPQETADNVKSNFDIRRYYSAEGYSVTINGITEQIIVQDHANPINESDVDKKILIPIESNAKSGDYVVFDTVTWIINSRINNVDNAYKMCQIQYCNTVIKFQSLNGTIISYPCITSGKTFSNDENQVLTLPSNQKSILLPYDEYTKLLDIDKRLFVDKDNKKPFKIIGSPDNTTYNYGDKGLIYFIVEQDVLQTTDGELPKDRPDLGICNYFEPTITPPPVQGETYSVITSSGDLVIGGSTRTLSVKLYNVDETENTTIMPVWDIILPVGYESFFTVNIIDNLSKITVDENYELIDKIVTVNVSDGIGGYVGNISLIIMA